MSCDDLRERIVTAGLRLLHHRGPAELTVRRVAEAAGTSTMGVYTRFGNRADLLNSLYDRGFALLKEAMAGRGEAASVPELAAAYREFAVSNPPLYAFMFERSLPGFDPSVERRTDALGSTFALLVGAVERLAGDAGQALADPTRTAYLVWTALHGMVSIELTHAARSPMPGWVIAATTEDGERVLVEGIGAVLRGLGLVAGVTGFEPGARGT